MNGFRRELTLEELPTPPLFKLVDPTGNDVFQKTTVGGEKARVGAVFSDRELAGEFSASAEENGMGAFAGLKPDKLPDWRAIEEYAASGADYVLVISREGAGLFHAGDVAHVSAERAEEIPFPLYIMADERGEAPLISVETGGEEALVAALFSSPEKARAFRERAAHLELPEHLGTIEDPEGLKRHALVARHAGADYAVIDPESGFTEAIPVEDLIR